eukprot:109528-Chlamydomonas_euryale.AAC.1
MSHIIRPARCGCAGALCTGLPTVRGWHPGVRAQLVSEGCIDNRETRAPGGLQAFVYCLRGVGLERSRVGRRVSPHVDAEGGQAVSRTAMQAGPCPRGPVVGRRRGNTHLPEFAPKSRARPAPECRGGLYNVLCPYAERRGGAE